MMQRFQMIYIVRKKHIVTLYNLKCTTNQILSRDPLSDQLTDCQLIMDQSCLTLLELPVY